MKRLISILVFIPVVMGVTLAAADTQDYANTIQVFRNASAVKPFFDSAYGYAVYPVIGKAGFIVGGAFGKGRVYRHGEVTGSSSVIEASIGWQAGGAAFSEIIFFQDERAYNEFISGDFEFGANAQAVAVTAGVEATAGTSGAHASASAGPQSGVQAKTYYHKGIATFVHAEGGLLAGLSIGGQKFTFEPKMQRF